MSVFFNLLITWIVIMLCFRSLYCDSKNYCGAKFCNNTKEHVLCKFQTPGPANNCINYEKLFTTTKEKNDLLHKINSRRNKVASGEIRSLPAAENMVKLEWNKELELSAQRWVDQCVSSSLYDGTDSCRDLEYMSVGQNVATIYGEAPGLIATSMIDVWYMELLNVNISIISRYLPSSVTGMHHYEYFTQLAWGSTTQVGCGGVKFKEINMDSSLNQNRTVQKLVCNFAPSGNNFEKSVYNFGVPCSRCPFGSICDTEFKFLCSFSSTSTIIDIVNEVTINKNPQDLVKDVRFNNFNGVANFYKNSNFGRNADVERTQVTPTLMENIDTQFDFFSDLFEITKTPLSRTKGSTTKCKEVLAVDEFIDLLKSRLSNDRILKDWLLSSTKLPSPEPVFSDRTVAAIIKQLYSKKETPTTTTSTESLNSTLLVDLVEAVIFRHSDKYSSTENSKLLTQIVSNVRPIKIQAELGEIKSNKEFTGHYFFPEEEEQTEQETDDSYDEQLPTSEISLEIEDLKRNSGTKDFLEDILESDFMTEDTKRDIILPTINSRNGSSIHHNLYSNTKWSNSSSKHYKRFKRKTNENLFINYSDLLKKLAGDLKKLKLHERYHCAYNSTKYLLPKFCGVLGLVFTSFFVVLFLLK